MFFFKKMPTRWVKLLMENGVLLVKLSEENDVQTKKILPARTVANTISQPFM